MESNLQFIGEARGRLLMPWSCSWNAYVREMTADLEKEEMVPMDEVYRQANEKAAQLMEENERLQSELHDLREAIAPGRVAKPEFYIGVSRMRREKESAIVPLESGE